jgi:hypothetical protein
LQFRSDPHRHITLLDVATLSDAAFTAAVRDLVRRTTSRDVLVFVHGYNVAFPAALMRTAQLAWDLDFQGIPMTYSWPSESRAVSYTVDESNIGWTQEHFRTFLRKVLVDVGAESVHVIAHSMGNRALAETLRNFDPGALPAGAARLRGRLCLRRPTSTRVHSGRSQQRSAEGPSGLRCMRPRLTRPSLSHTVFTGIRGPEIQVTDSL